jgi:hypothetical protein
MINTISIKRSELQRQIDSRNYYMGDAAKKKDPNAATIQSSKYDEEQLYMFIERACNELITAVALRFPCISFNSSEDNIEITFDTESPYPEHLLPMLEQSITGYLVNEATLQWLLLRKPEMSQSYISLRSSLYNNVQHLFAKIYSRKKLRRRATDLAGI